ncbi:ubiquitin domain-containing protein [Diplodia corticola]|uniref:Ubiquitin domain-containing protein n=1 Tax=Diplodia corticola TaxID=236234 RepID=A0A1J9R841_9PEZI|nr:ubiquitin domain-containing protein [Diplodia corticola]OJD37718.1 ubiquitin domain-containing protein [Diplodia corticola]
MMQSQTTHLNFIFASFYSTSGKKKPWGSIAFAPANGRGGSANGSSPPGGGGGNNTSIIPSSNGAAAVPHDHAVDDSSRANINNPASSLLVPQPHSAQSFLSTSASDDNSPRPSDVVVDHDTTPGGGGVGGSSGWRLMGRRGSRNIPASSAAAVAAAAAAASQSTATKKDSRPNKPLVAIDRGRRCKGPVLDGGLAASPSLQQHGGGGGGSYRKGSVSGSARAVSAGGPVLTRARLEKERNAFWDTRVTGHAEIWGAVRLAAELVRGGDVASAQGVLDAAGATCPTGEMWRGVFDEWGIEYRVPEWAVVEPAGVVEVDDDGGEDDDGEDGVEEQSLAEEKGKGKMGEIVNVRARLSDRGTDVVVQVGMEERVSAAVARIVEAAKLPATTRVRIAYLGKILREHDSLAAQGYSEGHVVNALVF